MIPNECWFALLVEIVFACVRVLCPLPQATTPPTLSLTVCGSSEGSNFLSRASEIVALAGKFPPAYGNLIIVTWHAQIESFVPDDVPEHEICWVYERKIYTPMQLANSIGNLIARYQIQ